MYFCVMNVAPMGYWLPGGCWTGGQTAVRYVELVQLPMQSRPKILKDKSTWMQIWLTNNSSHSWQHGSAVELRVGVWVDIALLSKDGNAGRKLWFE